MKDEQDKTIEALRFSIQMEIDGKEYYQQASRESSGKTGKELFQWLAGEEDKHRRKFEQIYKAIEANKAWPEMDMQPGKGIKLSTLFSKAKNKAVPKGEAQQAELNAIAKAMEMENKTRDFYKSQNEEATYEAESNFYKALAMEEMGHYLALVDYREYLIDPAGWFRKTEHHSLDGG
jgi:rubrerythrin